MNKNRKKYLVEKLKDVYSDISTKRGDFTFEYNVMGIGNNEVVFVRDYENAKMILENKNVDSVRLATPEEIKFYKLVLKLKNL